MSDLVTIDIQDHVAHVRLNRPEKMNALSMAMFEAITAAGREVAGDRNVRAAVLSGEGRAFCAGLDLENFANSDPNDDFFGAGRGGFWPNFYQLPAYAWKSVPVPVICALHGVAYGGGLQIALGADIRIAHPDTRVSLMEIKWGLVPDMSASQTLRDLVRLDVAKELTFTGRVVEGSEAADLGLVTRLADDPLAAALDMAAGIAGRNPDAITHGKYLLDNSWHGDHLAGLRLEERLQDRTMGKPNQLESVMAGMEGRSGNYTPRHIATFEDLDNL
ncbi:crotonase/enoyl-CoA hydratase family protein [Seongchinamella sediminis]|uniref:Crotonase/enoyl-CoA hydratase family protein n=1 Tax=Seongchinamella sediminis TaxID=2283635 RepID=A0A3L7E3C3_9GAMM|nr:crotonase/enoyl-CoA hydratase family protein [Seongchinamella sediminis]RLQ22792.1 crotonase/enoyl-CoA hydratase family protein [Seongchinamella sediminis]